MASGTPNYQVFVNCPFDCDYAPFLKAITFTVYACGFALRCALEVDDASVNRLEKIMRIMGECRLSIHDISRTEIEEGLPRFNVPLELGLFLGAKKFGGARHKDKQCLILDCDPYRSQRFLSDLAGRDVTSHGGAARGAVVVVRNWLENIESGSPSGGFIWQYYQDFLTSLPAMCREASLESNDLTFNEYTRLVILWLHDAKIGVFGLE